MRTAELKPVEVPGQKRPWRLNIPPSLSHDGKRHQLYFETKAKAESHAMSLMRKQALGDLVRQLGHHELSEAVRALELLRPRKLGLLDAVTRFLADHDRRAASKTFGACFDTYANLKERSKEYADELRHTRAAVASLLDRPIPDVTADDLAACLKGFAASTRDARIRRLRSVYAHAVRKGWTSTNTADRLDIVGTRHDEVQVYSVDEVERMLRTALEHDRQLLPFLAICAFCGLRPEREAFELDWSDVHLDDPQPQVVVRPELSKVRRRRFVDVPPAAIAWLDASGAKREGRVCGFSFTTLKRKRRENRRRAGVRMISDGLRHSYCSAFLAAGGDVNKLLTQTGHTSISMLMRHYWRVMRADQDARYWSLRP
jgi:integrase